MRDLGRVRGRRSHVLRRQGRVDRARHPHAWARLPGLDVPPRLIEAVIFDLDGVILDTEELWNEVREGLARERGGRWSGRAQADMMGMSSPEWSRYMHDVVGLREPSEEISAEVVRRMGERYRERLPLLPGAIEAVERLAARWPPRLAAASD